MNELALSADEVIDALTRENAELLRRAVIAELTRDAALKKLHEAEKEASK
ncbi:MAG: hypothetical protein HXL64_02870 [Thermobifida sp.]|nr:hypothetical protein [Thermobifida sp.]DAS03288.1 MAG TPA: hypothetical protein [Caudoviricetes sp.]DAS48475.1 MAG TPA: hypothetical protein [Caudoviricetes sp.]DAS79815.1 MAG TPA: hypothetical protein [Caudoviricetes sp.]